MAVAEWQDVLDVFAKSNRTVTLDRVRWQTRCKFRQDLSAVPAIYNSFSQLASLNLHVFIAEDCHLIRIQ
jgi:hypothetical protein